MNKTELASAVEAKTSLNKKQSEEAVSAVLASITAALADGEKVALYYGAADTVTGLAFGYISEIIEFVKTKSL